MLLLDHVMLAVPNLEDAARRLLDDVGLDAVPGGPHPGWGTANMLVPVGPQYIELIAVVDHDSTHPIAASVRAAAGDWAAVGVCCEVDDIEATATRIGSAVMPGSRTYADGTEVTWRLTGVEAALSRRLPFFIQWDTNRNVRTGQREPDHRVPVSGLVVEVGGEIEEVRTWLGHDASGLELVGGPAGPRRVIVTSPSGDIPLG